MKIAPTNFDCACGHPPRDHVNGSGRCDGECYDPEYGIFACLCHAYEGGDE